ncbi:MAG: NgoMIV family type II restriction endonuclease [Candidatus Hydrogenedentota bacterium]
MATQSFLNRARRAFHQALFDSVLSIDETDVPNNADRHSTRSVAYAQRMAELIGLTAQKGKLAGQMVGSKFEEVCRGFVDSTFTELQPIRPGAWRCESTGGSSGIARFEQYAHLKALAELAEANPELASALGMDYLIYPDIFILRMPEQDEDLNAKDVLVDEGCSRLTPLRAINNELPILHASISCKWTIRSDRVQNTRSEALNLIRNRKGKLPHIVAVTGEPLPARISSIALGTGDMDCVYHVALYELQQAVREHDEEGSEMLDIMISGKRLRDISDLPLDLAI